MEDKERFANLQKETFELFRKKNVDYGSAFKEYGVIGILVRMNDKIKRFQNISKTGIILVGNEKIRDTLLDLSNYALMGAMLLDEDKENEKGDKNE